MASFRQIEGQPPQCRQKQWSDYSGRQTALPRNAVRHRVAAETVIGALEDAEDYKTRRSKQPSNLPNFALDAAMKQPLGAKLARSYLHSMPWIAANHKKEDAASVSTIIQHCQPMSAANLMR